MRQFSNLKIVKSLQHAMNGITESLRSERNLKIQTSLAAASVAMGFYLNVNSVEWMILCLTICLVLSAELMNTSIENVVNLVSPQFHPLARKAKDASAAAVLVLSIGSLFVGWFIFGIKIKSLFFNA